MGDYQNNPRRKHWWNIVEELICSKCEKKLKSEERFCPYCGLKIDDEKIDDDSGLILGGYGLNIDPEDPPKRRNYWKWLLISIVTFGIGGLVYLYLKSRDIDNLGKVIQDPLGRVRSRGDSSIICDLCCMAIMVEVYHLYYSFQTVKYLRKYLKYNFDEMKKYPLNQTIVLISKLINFLIVVIGTPIVVFSRDNWSSQTVMIVAIVLASIVAINLLIIIWQMATWQKAFNTFMDQVEKRKN
ncbi:MAG: zinc-ribbon domain-containing protein [Asgard group archaeon]|nr:zinc-ribbon domain-containing protein [Asgard group archaeon]